MTDVALSQQEEKTWESVAEQLSAAELNALDDWWRRRLLRSRHPDVEVFRRVAQWRARLHEPWDPSILRRVGYKGAVGGEVDGHVIWCEQAHTGILTLDRPALLEARGRITESVEKKKRKSGNYKHIYVLDVGVLGWEATRFKNELEAVIDFGSRYYPEGSHRIFIVNAPLVARSLFMVFKKPHHKIRILGSDFLSAMAADGVPSSAIPTMLGGTHPGIDVLDLLEVPPTTPEQQRRQVEEEPVGYTFSLFGSCRRRSWEGCFPRGPPPPPPH